MNTYLREDMLAQYGYTYEDINTWDDLKRVGKDILEKTSGEVRILNGVGQDYEDIISLLVMQAMEGSNDKGKIEELSNCDVLTPMTDRYCAAYRLPTPAVASVQILRRLLQRQHHTEHHETDGIQVAHETGARSSVGHTKHADEDSAVLYGRLIIAHRPRC